MSANLRSRKHPRGYTLTGVLVAVVLVGIATAGIVQLSLTLGETRRDIGVRTQEDAYRSFQQEIAVTGSNPNGMNSNPLSGSALSGAPAPSIAYSAAASRDQAGSADVGAYVAAPDSVGRSGSMGYRISSTGAAVAGPVVGQLAPPTFRVSGLIPASEFTPDLQNLILAAASNPPGTVYRYTTDGSDPTSTSPVWFVGSSSLPGAPLAPLVKAAAFSNDPAWTQSAVVDAALQRELDIVYGREAGGTSTAFAYAEVAGGTNRIVLTIPGAPSGTEIYYTVDGSLPSPTSTRYTGPFHVPLGSWGATVSLRVAGVAGTSGVPVNSISEVLTPISTQLPPPSFGTVSGTTTSASVPVNAAVAGVRIRYSIDGSITASSPTIEEGQSVVVTAP